MLTGTLYAQSYAIDCDAIGSIKCVSTQKDWLGRWKQRTPAFAKLCYSTAGVSAAGWDTAANGIQRRMGYSGEWDGHGAAAGRADTELGTSRWVSWLVRFVAAAFAAGGETML